MDLGLSWNLGPGVDLGNSEATVVHALSPLEGREEISPEREREIYVVLSLASLKF